MTEAITPAAWAAAIRAGPDRIRLAACDDTPDNPDFGGEPPGYDEPVDPRLYTAGPSGPLTTALPCLLHTKHTPASHVNHRHHIWPLGEGGPDTADNIVVVCPTGHSNIHHLIGQYKAHRGEPPYAVTRTYAFAERRYAEQGWRAIAAGGR